MLDRKFILENLDLIAANNRNRGVTADLERFATLEEKRRELTTALNEINQSANAVAKQIKSVRDANERQELIDKGRALRAERDAIEAQLSEVGEEADAIRAMIPNLSHAAAPLGPDDSANQEIAFGKTPKRTFGFTPRDHVELGEVLDLFDFEGGSKVTGHGFYFLKNEAVLLDLAIQRYVIDILLNAGFTLLSTPDLARSEILKGTGFVPRGPETQIYNVEETDLSLIATAEITLGGLYAGEALPAEKLPLRLAGLSHCFRTEAGAHGRATRGLYRVHQFTKVEMFAYTTPERSEAMHEEMREIEERIFDGLEIPYRVVENATGDLGASAYRKYDIEAWMPGRGEGGSYGEVTSTSNCTDYQARRLNIRYRGEDGKIAGFLHTLNGTASATGRTMIAILENHQEVDGSVLIPQALRDYMGGRERIVPKG